jgi:hypothetical protein
MIRLINERESYLSAAAFIGDAAEALTSAAQTLAMTDPRLESVASSLALASDNLMGRVISETPRDGDEDEVAL